MTEDEWRPISTAPRDGTEIDVWCRETKGDDQYEYRVTDAHWSSDLSTWLCTGHGRPCMWVRQPTHWMPRPEPPEDAVMTTDKITITSDGKSFESSEDDYQWRATDTLRERVARALYAADNPESYAIFETGGTMPEFYREFADAAINICMEEAADEIERLRVEISDLNTKLDAAKRIICIAMQGPPEQDDDKLVR